MSRFFFFIAKLLIIFFSASPFLFSSPLLSLSVKIILSVSPLQVFCCLFLLFACVIRFLQRPSCPKFRLSGLYNLCPLPASPSALNWFVRPAYRAFAVFLTSCLFHLFSAKTFLSEIPSPRSLQPLSHANITISPKTDLSEYLSQLRVVFPAALLPKLYFLSLSRCFRFLISHVPSFLIYCKMQIISFSASPVLFSFPLLSLSKKIILSVSPLHGLCRLSYVSLVSSVFCKDLPVRNSVSEVFTILTPFLHHHQPENRTVRVSVSAPRRFSCQSFVQTLFSIAFALFSVFSLQVLFLFDLTLFFFSRLVLFSLRPCPCSSCLFPQALHTGNFPFPYLYKWIDSIDTLPWQKRCSQTFSLTRLAHIPLFQPVFSLAIDQDISLRPCFSYAPDFCAPF